MKLSYPVATPDTRDAGMLALRGDPAECFELLAATGYGGAELMPRDPAGLDPERFKVLAADVGLGLAGVSTGQLRKEDGLQLCHADPAARAQAVTRTKAVIDFAAAAGAGQVNIGTLRGSLPPDPAGQDAARARAAESLHELLDYALPRGVGVALEPQCRYVSNWLNTAGETLQWMEQFRQPNLSLLFDAYHSLLEERSVYAALIRAFPRVSHVQVADTNRLPPGGGQAAIGDLVRVLRALGYRGYVSVEVQQQPDGPAAARAAARHLLPYFAEADGA
jgi:sugar phosphate isomerase/epimerase